MGDRPDTPAAVGAYVLTSLAHALMTADALLAIVALIAGGSAQRFPLGLGVVVVVVALAAVVLYFRASDLRSTPEPAPDPDDHTAADFR